MTGMDKSRRLAAHIRAIGEGAARPLGLADLRFGRIEVAEPGGLASRMSERFRDMAAGGIEHPLPTERSPLLVAADRLLEAASVANVTRMRLVSSDATLKPDQAAAEIDVAVSLLMAASRELRAAAGVTSQ